MSGEVKGVSSAGGKPGVSLPREFNLRLPEKKLDRTLESWLCDSSIAKCLISRPFVVGIAKQLIYGAFLTMASRSPKIAALGEDLDTIIHATEDDPIPLLEDDPHFGPIVTQTHPADGVCREISTVQKQTSAFAESLDESSLHDEKQNWPFRIVWGYLNGILTEFRTNRSGDKVWPCQMSIHEKYRVLYYTNYFNIPPDAAFVRDSLHLFVNDLIDELNSSSLKESDLLLQLAFDVRPFILRIIDAPWLTFQRLAAVLPDEHKRNMIYGLPSRKVPPPFREILPTDDVFSYTELKSAKNLSVEVYSTWGYDPDKPISRDLGAWTVTRIQHLTASEITGVVMNVNNETQVSPDPVITPEVVDNLPPISDPYGLYTDSPYGFGAAEVAGYYMAGPQARFMLVIITTSQGEIGLFESPSRKYWIVPQFGITGSEERSKINEQAKVRFFADKD